MAAMLVLFVVVWRGIPKNASVCKERLDVKAKGQLHRASRLGGRAEERVCICGDRKTGMKRERKKTKREKDNAKGHRGGERDKGEWPVRLCSVSDLSWL
jgi:hypothetical protein